jgi:hypothetical protein
VNPTELFPVELIHHAGKANQAEGKASLGGEVDALIECFSLLFKRKSLLFFSCLFYQFFFPFILIYFFIYFQIIFPASHMEVIQLDRSFQRAIEIDGKV